MQEKEINELLQRFLEGKTSPEEDESLECWFEMESEQGDWSWRDTNHREAMAQRMHQSLLQRIEGMQPGRVRRLHWGRWFAAASVLLALGVGMGMYFFDSRDSTERIHQQFADEAVPAGTEAAILVLADGKTIRLDALQDGTILADGKMKIQHLQDGGIAYESTTDGRSHPQNASNETNTIHIPKGSNFQLTLPDGTTAWMNAGSSLTYPLQFGSTERRVTLLGEAFFDVAHDDSRPFHVMAKQLDVRVTGTTFNVKAYTPEQEIAVTLETGSVNIKIGDESLALVPGEQAYTHASSRGLQKQKVDVEDALAWKNGYFSFENQKIEAIMANIARWYDCVVEFEDGISNRRYNGRITRSRPLEEVLASLEALGDVKFKTEGRRIVVMD